MRLPKFEFVEPKTLREAVKVLATDPKGSALLAGGTDLLVNMKHRVLQPQTLVNLKSIPKLAYISEEKDGVRVGALTTLNNLAFSPVIQEKYPALAHAATEVGAYAHQSMGTIGGNLCQGNRCRFYNQSPFWRSVRSPCLKVGGGICHVVPVRTGRKAKECHSAYCGDVAPVLIALGSQIKVSGPDGERSFSLKKLYTSEGIKPLAFKKGEILKEVFIPSPSGRTLYLKWRVRNSLEFPIVSLAVRVDFEGDRRIKSIRIVFSGVGPGPIEAAESEKLLKNGLLEDPLIEKVSTQAGKEISPMRTSLHSPAYKRKMAGILLRQALEQLRNAP